MMQFTRLVRAALVAAVFPCIGISGSAQDQAEQPMDIREIQRLGKMPRGIKQDPPIYPYGMSQAGLIGTVTLEFIINRQGEVSNPFVVESNNPWFERPAIEAVMQWKFQPGEMRGSPVNTRVRQQIEFRIDGGGRGFWAITKTKNHKQLPPEMQWDRPPVVLHSTFPVYPFEALRDKVKGKTRLTLVIGPDGRVKQAKILEATVPEFGLATLAMADAWRFQPAQKKDGTPSYAIIGMDHEFNPSGRGDVPVADEAPSILRKLAREPAAILTMKDLDRPLKPLSRRPPLYPSALETAGQPGSAVIEFFVDERGDAQLPRIVSSTAPEFGYAAVQAVATWRFEPPRKGGKAVVTRVQITIDFDMRAPKPAGSG
jgi:TonB family protein